MFTAFDLSGGTTFIAVRHSNKKNTQIKSFFVPAVNIRALLEHKSKTHLTTYNKTPAGMH